MDTIVPTRGIGGGPVRVLVSLTARQLLGRKRALLIGLAMLIPVVISIVYSATDADSDSVSERLNLAAVLGERMILTLLMPLVALVLGTTALGGEVEDGTVVFLLTKPIKRRTIIAVKMCVAAAATVLLTVPAAAAAAWLIVGNPATEGIVAGVSLGVAAGAVMYSVVFVALSALTHRALVIGLVYVFVWEAVIANIFTALRWVSIREYSIGWAGAALGEIDEGLDANLGVTGAIVASAIVIAGAVIVGTRALERFEIGERA